MWDYDFVNLENSVISKKLQSYQPTKNITWLTYSKKILCLSGTGVLQELATKQKFIYELAFLKCGT